MLGLEQIKDKVLITNVVMALVIPMPFSLRVTSLVVGLMVVVNLFFNYKNVGQSLKNNYLFYQVYLVGLLFVLISPATRFQTLEVRLPFILFSLFLTFPKRSIDFTSIKKAFIIGVLTYISWSFVYTIYFYFSKSFAVPSLEYARYIIYHYMPGHIHHTYFGMYLSLALIMLLFSKEKLFGKYNVVIVGVVLLSYLLDASKLSFIIASIIIGTRFYNKINKKYLVGFAVLIVAFVKVFYVQILSSFESRITIWKASLDLFLESPFFGYGTDSAKIVLGKYFEHNDYIINYFGTSNIDTHNLYLDFVINFGVLGLVSLFVYFYFLKRIYKSLEANLFLLTIFLYGFIEHIFNLQYGVIFVVYFSLLYFYQEKNNVGQTN